MTTDVAFIMDLLRYAVFTAVMDELGFLHSPLTREFAKARCFQKGINRTGTRGGPAIPLPAPHYIRGCTLPENIGFQNAVFWLELRLMEA
jgi:hypothetical protein